MALTAWAHAMVKLQGKASRLPISTTCCQSWKKHVGARLRMLVSNGAWKSRPYDVAKVGMRLSPRLMLLVLACTRCWRPELCMLHERRESVAASIHGGTCVAIVISFTAGAPHGPRLRRRAMAPVTT